MDYKQTKESFVANGLGSSHSDVLWISVTALVSEEFWLTYSNSLRILTLITLPSLSSPIISSTPSTPHPLILHQLYLSFSNSGFSPLHSYSLSPSSLMHFGNSISLWQSYPMHLISPPIDHYHHFQVGILLHLLNLNPISPLTPPRLHPLRSKL